MEQEQEQPGAEESADFARVAAMAQEGEPVAVTEPEAPRIDAAESMAALLGVLGVGLAVAGMKRTAAVWNPATCGELAEKTVPVLRKYPWGARVLAFFEQGTGAEELALLMCAAPLGMATWKAAQADMAADDAPAEEQPRIAAENTGADDSGDLGALVEVHGHADK